MPKPTHDELMVHMGKLGYPVDYEGTCHGIALTGIQSLALGDEGRRAFNERLDFIDKHKKLNKDVARVKAKLVKKKNELRGKAGLGKAKPFMLSSYDHKIFDVISFFETVTLHQRPEIFPAFFEKSLSQIHSDTISLLASSLQFEKMGNLKKIISWPGIFSDAELITYCSSLEEIAKKANESFSLLLFGRHSIALHYDATINQWFLLDANQLPIHEIDITKFASYFKKTMLEEGQFAAFETILYHPGNAYQAANQILAAFNSSSAFTELYAITGEKVLRKSDTGCTLAHMAAQDCYVDYLIKLQQAGCDFNERDKEGKTPIWIASQYNQGKAISVLVENGADANKPEHANATPVYVAAWSGCLESILALWKAKANFETPTNEGKTPAVIATEFGHAKVLALFGQFGVDLNQETSFGTPMQISNKLGLAECIAVLKNYCTEEVKKVNEKKLPPISIFKPASPSKRKAIEEGGIKKHRTDFS